MPPQYPRPVALPGDLIDRLHDHFQRVVRTQSGDGVFQYRAEAQVDRIYDGDTWFGRHRPDPTLTVAMDTAHRRDRFDRNGQYYRLSDIDTHELNASDDDTQQMAREEKKWVENWVSQGRDAYDGAWPFVVDYGGPEYEGSFGRPLCHLSRKCDGAWLAEDLRAAFPDRDLTYSAARVPSNERAETAGVPWAASPDALP